MGTEFNYATFLADFGLVMRYTRRWLHYGLIGHTVLCTLVAAMEGLFTR